MVLIGVPVVSGVSADTTATMDLMCNPGGDPRATRGLQTAAPMLWLGSVCHLGFEMDQLNRFVDPMVHDASGKN